MREGWTYKKLGEVATIIGGSTPKSNLEEYWGGSHYWVTPADLKGNKYQGATPRTITNLAIQKTNLQLLPTGTVLLSSRAPIGKVAITTVPMYCNQGFKNVVCSEQLLNEFVYWYLLNKTDYLNSLGRGATFKEISKKATEQIPIPVPPLSEQQRIVNELDLLSSIIEKKKAQLKEYDQLAQSIFYDMFGDPVSNEKGWKIKKLGEVCKLFAGGDVPKDRFSRTKTKDMSVPIYSNGIENNGLYGYTDIPKVSECCITITGRGTIGHVEKRNIPFYPIIRLLVAIPIVPLDISYFSHLISIKDFKGNGGAIPQLTVPMIKNEIVPIPPLTLQQSFASKIEAIERQKALVRQSITEAETLFNSRMDYYFN